MKFKDRVDKTFDRYGEDFLINGAASAKGFFQQIGGPAVPAYFDGMEQDSAERYALMAMVPADAVVAVGDTITRRGRAYTVAKASSQRVRNAVVMHILLLK